MPSALSAYANCEISQCRNLCGRCLNAESVKRDMPQRECRHLWIMQRMWGEQLRKKSNPMDPSHSRFPFHCWNPFFFFSKKWERQRQELRFLHLQALISFLIYSTDHNCVYPLCVLHGLEGKKRCHHKWKYTEGFAIVRCYLIGIGFRLRCVLSRLNVNLSVFFFFSPRFFFSLDSCTMTEKCMQSRKYVHITHTLTASFKRLSLVAVSLLTIHDKSISPNESLSVPLTSSMS